MSGSSGRGYSFRISADGMKEFAADVRQLSGQSEAVHAAFSKLIQSSPQLANAMTLAEEATKKAADRARELREQQERAAAAANSLPGAVTRAGEAFNAMEGRAQGARRAVGDLRGAMELLGAGTVGEVLGPIAGQLGNVADAFGTAALAARSGTSALGLVVPVLGAVAAAAGALYLAYDTIRDSAKNYGTEQDRLNVVLGFAAGAQDAYRRAVELTDPLLETAEDRSIRLANQRRNEAQETLKAAEATNALARAEAARIQNNLNGSLATAAEDPGAYGALGFGGVSPAETQARVAFLTEQLRLVQERAATLAREAEDIATRRAVLGNESGRILYGAPIGPNLPAGFGAGGGGGRAADTLPDLSRTIYEAGAGTVFPVDAVEPALRAARQREEQEDQRLRQAREREERDYLRRIEQANQRTTDSIVTYAAGAFADLWQNTGGGFDALMQRLRQTAIQTFARIAAEAVIRPIIAPIVSGLGLGGLTGSGGAGGVGGGIGDLFGIGSSINSLTGGGIANALGLGGIGSSIGGLMATPLFAGSAGLSVGGLSGAGGLAALEAAGGAAAASGGFVTLGSILGPAALGFAGGGLLAGLTGGNQLGGSIGGGLGAGIGFMVGGPLGALLGGVGGSLLGGMFGNNKPSNREGNATIDLLTGGLTIGGQTGGKFSQANRDAARGSAQQIQALLSGIAGSVGGTLGGGSVMVGVGDRDGIFANLDGQQLGRWGRDEAGVQALLDAVVTRLVPNISGGRSDLLRTALATSGASSASEITGIADWFGQVYRPLTEIKEPVDAFEEAMKTLNKTFDDAVARAKELGLQETELQAGRQRAVAELEQQRRNGALGALTGPVSGLADFVRSLRVANDNPLSPNARLDAARADFEATIGRALDGDLGAFGRVQGSAQSLLAVSRDVNGSGTGFAADFQATLARLDSLSGLSEDRLTAAVYAAEMRSQTDVFREEIGRLRAEIVGLRAEVQQGNRIPSRLVA